MQDDQELVVLVQRGHKVKSRNKQEEGVKQ